MLSISFGLLLGIYDHRTVTNTRCRILRKSNEFEVRPLLLKVCHEVGSALWIHTTNAVEVNPLKR